MEDEDAKGSNRVIAIIGECPAEYGAKIQVSVAAWTAAPTEKVPNPKESPPSIRVLRIGKKTKSVTTYKTAAEAEGVAKLLVEASTVLAKALGK